MEEEAYLETFRPFLMDVGARLVQGAAAALLLCLEAALDVVAGIECKGDVMPGNCSLVPLTKPGLKCHHVLYSPAVFPAMSYIFSNWHPS